jgi:RNA polymerase sigma-70 factor (ECF subfamily)
LRSDPRPEVDPEGRREVVNRFLAAWDTGDTKAMVALMNQGSRMVMPPIPLWVEGPADILRVLDDYPFRRRDPHRWKLVAAPPANGESAMGFYVLEDGTYRPWGIQVLVMAPSTPLPVVTEYHVFKTPHLVKAFGLPESLPDQRV